MKGSFEETLKEVKKSIKKEVHVFVDQLGDATQAAISLAEARINRRFDKLGDILLGVKDNNKPSLTELAKKWRADNGPLLDTRGFRETPTESEKS